MVNFSTSCKYNILKNRVGLLLNIFDNRSIVSSVGRTFRGLHSLLYTMETSKFPISLKFIAYGLGFVGCGVLSPQ